MIRGESQTDQKMAGVADLDTVELLCALEAVEIGTEPIKNNRPVFMPDRTIGRSIYAHACIRPAEETLCALSTEST